MAPPNPPPFVVISKTTPSHAGIMRVPFNPFHPSKIHSPSIQSFHPLSPQLRCTSHQVHHHNSTLTPTHLHTLLTITTNNCASSYHAAQIHTQLIITNSLPIPLLHTQLINLYARCGQLPRALLTFKTTQKHSNIVTWTSLITHLAQFHQPFEALSLFAQLKREGLGPNPYTFSAILPACAETRSALHGSQVHGLACKHGVDADVFVASALADMYAKCGDMNASKRMFDEMPHRNLVSWNAMIVGFVRNNLYDKAIWMFRALLMDGSVSPNQVGISSVLSACANSAGLGFGRRVHAYAVKLGLESVAYVKNSLIDMYSKCGRFEEALGMFDIINERDVVTWNTMMMGWIQNDHFEEACSCFQAMMREEILPDEASFSTVLRASASLAAWGQGAAIHTLIVKTGFGNNQCIGSSLITMYAKCGSLDDAYQSFQEMKHHQNVVSWTSIIAAFQQHGHGNRVIELFDRMLEEGMEPDYITFVCVLSACSYSGLIEQGFRYFKSMSQVHNMAPRNEHYACIVDMLGRAGRLAEGKQFIDTMPIKPDASVWGALLGACSKSGNLELGKEVAQRLFEIEPANPGNYVLLANLYVRYGRLEEAEDVRRLMGYNGVRKETGCSWIDVKNKTYVFTVHDQSHPRTREIYEMLRRMEELVRVKGYMAEIQFAVNDVGEYKEQSLWYHSERLALAFGLISLPMDAPIRIKKNLRTCGDCHTVMKLASGIFGREIVLRDTNRFHRFASGSCSCGDYW